MSAETETGVMDQVEDGDEETEGMPRDEDPLAVVIQYRGDSESRSVSPAPTICSTTSQSEDEEKVRRKRPKQSTKTLIDNKREKLQKSSHRRESRTSLFNIHRSSWSSSKP